ncbi:MAG: bifunctional riboflavin kinase/FAD synthetase [Polaribacter sp.]|nr:bifunctional riboflavin kinase/FAD synthetase [Polaribacter sp.]
MEIIHSLSNYQHTENTVVTIGTFDGVHIGHQKIIEQVVETAKKLGTKSVLLTFFPNPRMVLQQNASIELINTIDERAELLSKTGLDYLIIHPFSIEFSRLTALDFVRKILVNQLNTSKLIIGYDHHFGKNREGNLEQLTEYSHLYNFEVEEIPAQDINDVSVSSTKIRKALSDKNIKTANKYLGYHFMLNGTVVNGKQLGGKIGFPTANISIKEDYKLIPKMGVYVVKSKIDNNTIFGMMNIGFRPTLEGKHQTIEVHFFNFEKDLYNQNLTIEILYFLRDEEKFDSVEKLILQLKEDEKIALNYIQNNL